MNWFNQIVNKDSVPKEGQIYVAIQNGKAMRYNDANHFGHIHKVLSFPSVELANYFISKWDSNKLNDYRQAMPKESFVFYVYDKCRDGYYADDIRMYPEWESTII